MRAIKIDPTNRAITEVDVKTPNKSLQSFYELVGCDLVEIVPIDPEIALVCDECAKLKPITGAFRFFGVPEIVFAGNAVVTGFNGVRFSRLHENIESLRKIVEWIEPKDVPPAKMKIIGFN